METYTFSASSVQSVSSASASFATAIESGTLTSSTSTIKVGVENSGGTITFRQTDVAFDLSSLLPGAIQAIRLIADATAMNGAGSDVVVVESAWASGTAGWVPASVLAGLGQYGGLIIGSGGGAGEYELSLSGTPSGLWKIVLFERGQNTLASSSPTTGEVSFDPAGFSLEIDIIFPSGSYGFIA